MGGGEVKNKTKNKTKQQQKQNKTNKQRTNSFSYINSNNMYFLCRLP